MTASFTIWFQIVALLIDFINANLNLLPENWKPRLVAALGAIQAIQAVLAHYSAPNGQRLTAGHPAYQPPPGPPPDGGARA